MSFTSIETSRSLGQPITLIRFDRPPNTYAYTDAENPVTFGVDQQGSPLIYQPVPLSRDSIVSQGSLDRSTLKIQLPRSTPIVELFRVFPPSDVVNCVIFQGHVDDPDSEFKAVWSGRVLSSSHAGSKGTLNCEPISTSMRRPGLRRRWQYGCPHALYGPQCSKGIVGMQASFTINASPISVAGALLSFGAGWNGVFDPARFLDGLAQWTTADGVVELRSIIRVEVTNRQLTVSGQLSGLNAGDPVALSLGCNHQMDGCTIFSNIHNFGGQPWIPKQNPVGFVNQFY